MILASSSGDHFDCFFAGDSDVNVDDRSAARLAGMTLDVEPVVYVLDDVDCPVTLRAESDGALDRGCGGER